MHRRALLASTGAAFLVPSPSRSQGNGQPTIGYLSSLSERQVMVQTAAFRRGLGEVGFAEGRNVAIEFAWAEGHFDRLPTMASQLAGRPVSIILAQAPPAALAAKAATTAIPIVFVVGFDPVGAGLVASLSRPGGNVTGMTLLSPALGQKRLEIIRDLVPQARTVAMLVNPPSPDARPEIDSVQAAIGPLGFERLAMYEASSLDQIEVAFDRIAVSKADGLLVGTDPFFLNVRDRIVLRATQLRIPAVYPFRDCAVSGGLLSYGATIANSYRQAGIYVGRILKGDKPAELPVMLPTAFQLVINLKAAQPMDMDIPAALHARSDETID